MLHGVTVKLLAALLLLVVGSCMGLRPSDAATYTLTIDNPAPAHGEAVAFSGTFPQAAFKQARQPQTPNNPAFSLSCGNTTQTVYREFWSGIWSKTTKNADGTWNAVSAPLALDAASWPADATEVVCHAFAGWWSWSHGSLIWNAAGALVFAVSP